MKRILILAILLLSIATTAAAQRVAGSWRWVPLVVSDYTSAVSVAAAGAQDPKLPQIITTGDDRAPFVVYSYQFVDMWCCLPQGFRGEILPIDDALFRYRSWRRVTYRKAGLLTMPDGTAIVWMTY